MLKNFFQDAAVSRTWLSYTLIIISLTQSQIHFLKLYYYLFSHYEHQITIKVNLTFHYSPKTIQETHLKTALICLVR